MQNDHILGALPPIRVESSVTDRKPVGSDDAHPYVGDLIFLLGCVLENNYFEFDGKYYKQIIGCSMVAIPSPEISDMRMYGITRYIEFQFQYSNKKNFTEDLEMMDLSFLMDRKKKSLSFLTSVTTVTGILNSHLKFLKHPWIFLIQRSTKA